MTQRAVSLFVDLQHYYFFFNSFKVVLFHATKHDPKRPEYKGPYRMDYREGGSHARGAYPTQDISRMGTARVEKEEEADTRIIVIEYYEIWKKGTWARKGKVSNKT